MRKSFLLAVVFCLAFAGSAHAAATGAVVQGKIGVFNSRAVAAETPALAAALKKQEGQFANEQKQLEQQQANLKKRADELQAQSAALSPEAREDKRTEFLRMKRDFEDRYQAFARKAEASAMKLQQEFNTNLAKAAQEFGSKNNYVILWDSMAGGPVYFDKSVDVTKEIAAEVNRLYKAGGK